MTRKGHGGREGWSIHEDAGGTDREPGAPRPSCPIPSGPGVAAGLGLPRWGNGEPAEGVPRFGRADF